MNKQQAKMKAARQKIEAVLKEYDLAGFVTIHGGADWGEVFWNMWPSWSVLRGDFPDIRITSKLSELPPEKHAHEIERRAQTAQAIHHIGVSMGTSGMQFLELATVIDKALGATHEDKGSVPDPGTGGELARARMP